jgi:hypothetical protein
VNSGVFGGVLLYDFMKTRVTPISQTKTQALARVLASVTHGYTRICMGTVPPERLSALAAKFDALYGIAHTKGQRVMNKRAGRASTLFAAYAPPDEYRVENERLPWMLLAESTASVAALHSRGARERRLKAKFAGAGTATSPHPVWIAPLRGVWRELFPRGLSVICLRESR